MSLTNYTFRLGDTGVVLNDDSVSVPFVDIDKVVGLDSPPFRETQRDHEGTDGGFMDAEFEKGREIFLEGTAYCSIGSEETYLDSLKFNYAPVTASIPFYLKAPGVNERLIFVKSRGVAYDWETLRRIGATRIQFKMYAEDPRIYDSTLQSSVINFGGVVATGFGFDNVRDTFTRSVSNDWGTSDSGHVYTVTGTASDYSITGAVGRQQHNAVNVLHEAVISTNFLTIDETIDVTCPVLPTGQNIECALVGRWVDANNFVDARVFFNTTNDVTCNVRSRSASVDTASGFPTVSGATATTPVTLRLQANGTGLRVKAWPRDTNEPAAWSAEIVSTHNATGVLRTTSKLNTGNTNTLPVNIDFDEYQFALGFGFNFGFGTTVAPNGATFTNLGNRPTPAIFTVTGPVLNPAIINDTLGLTLQFAIDLLNGQTLVINSADRTVLLNGMTNRRNTLLSPNWYMLSPGSNFIRFGGTSGTGTLTVSFRNAWR